MAMSENTKKILMYLRENDGADLTSADIAEALDIPKKSVDGAVTSGLQRKGYSVREEAEIQVEDGSHKKVKFIKLTDLGRTVDPDAEPVKDAE